MLRLLCTAPTTASLPARVDKAALVELVPLFLVDARATVERALAKAGNVLGEAAGVRGERHKLSCTCSLA